MSGYTSSEFAGMLGISKSTYSQIENGWTIPKRALLEKIAQLLNRDPDELLIKVRV
jgi:transcriptional regulator with XRE-family HTH domain